MYEKAGLSSLERVVGKNVSAICFVQDYVQVIFEELILTCYTAPTVLRRRQHRKWSLHSDGASDCRFLDSSQDNPSWHLGVA